MFPDREKFSWFWKLRLQLSLQGTMVAWTNNCLIAKAWIGCPDRDFPTLAFFGAITNTPAAFMAAPAYLYSSCWLAAAVCCCFCICIGKAMKRCDNASDMWGNLVGDINFSSRFYAVWVAFYECTESHLLVFAMEQCFDPFLQGSPEEAAVIDASHPLDPDVDIKVTPVEELAPNGASAPVDPRCQPEWYESTRPHEAETIPLDPQVSLPGQVNMLT